MTAKAKSGGRTAGAKSKKVRVRLVRSTIGFEKSQAKVVEGLGLRRIGHTVEVVDHPAMWGMIHKVRHLVQVEAPVSGGRGRAQRVGHDAG